MSNVNIKRAVENIRANTTVYTPVVEVVVNAIQAIDETKKSGGRIYIRALRNGQVELDGALPEITGFEIEDNGIGFTDENRDSFDTLYSDHKIAEGGKGFGRFTCLKYFENIFVESTYEKDGGFTSRKFSMGKENDIIVNEKVAASDKQEARTVVSLLSLKKGPSFDKKLTTIARGLVEKLLPYFITAEYVCPDIVLSEKDGSGSVRLNDYFTSEGTAGIREIAVQQNTFVLKAFDEEETFQVRVFRFYAPKNQKSKISLVAHKRDVSGSALHTYIPEFIEEFYEKAADGEPGRNYIIKAYVFSPYLDRNVSLERGGFEFQMENDLIRGIGQSAIEKEAATIAREAVGLDISSRQEKKRERVQSYVDSEAPWHKAMLSEIDLSTMAFNPSDEDIEIRLQEEKHAKEVEIKRDVNRVLSAGSIHNVKDVLEIVGKISDTSRNDLIHYIVLRRKILDIFGKSLQVDEEGAYSAEGVVHDIIFPRKGDTETASFDEHNLWIIDERLNFTNYVSSDVPLNGGNTERPDLIVYNKRVLFRGDNEASNPITIFEFKKPQRDDFVNPSSTEDPVQQIVRYVNNVRDGKYKTPEGRKMLVAENTPFYGYVVCDLTPKVENWLEREKDFTPMPDRLGWFKWMGNINLYVEVVSWDKVLRDARMRNQVFFQKLGI